MSGQEAQATVPTSGARWRVITLVVMAVAVAAVLGALVFTLAGANRERDRALALQKHSYDVMILARTLSGTMARAEASLGRYVIAGDEDERLGRIYVDRWRRAGVQLDQLDRITGDDQQRNIDRLRGAYRTRGDELDLIALSTRYGKNGQALARFYHARQTDSLTAIDRNLSEIIGQERRLLDARTTAAMASISRSSEVAEVLTGFGAMLVLGVVALGWITVRSLAGTAVAAATAAAAEARAEELARAVADATAELRIQEARLRQVQKMEAVGQLTGGIAHDFNNMLAVVSGGLELAARSLPANPAAARRHIASAGEGAARAAELTRRLLAFSREDQLKPEPIRVGALVAGMRDLLDRTLGDGVTVAMADTAEDWCVRADQVQLENAVLNLAVNARDAMDGRGELAIATRAARLADGEVGELAAGEYVAVSVADTGCGMTPEIAERVFEPFFTTKPVGKGTGLGLSQIFAFAGQHGGAIGIRTAPGEGTTVTLHLPRDLSGATAAPRPARPITAAAAAAAPIGLSVLVVEDDPRVLAATIAALQELGHRPVACDDPLAAPALLDAAGAIDLIVSDVLMPRQTGPEMVAGFAQRWPDLPVLFVTGFAGETGAAGLGGRPVLRKPFTLAALEQAIAELIPTAPAQVAAE